MHWPPSAIIPVQVPTSPFGAETPPEGGPLQFWARLWLAQKKIKTAATAIMITTVFLKGVSFLFFFTRESDGLFRTEE